MFNAWGEATLSPLYISATVGSLDDRWRKRRL